MSWDSPLSQLDTELLIREVKTRPDLYAKDAPKYNDSYYKRVLWDEVAAALFPDDWDKYDEEEKADKAELVQKRWKNVRACFSREIKRQKDPKWIYGVSYKRRKYLYFNELSFLKPHCENWNEEESTHDIDLPEKTGGESTTVTIDTNIEETPIPEPVPVPPMCKYDDKPDQSPAKKNNESDSTNFALSIVPMLNMIPIEKRIDAHISILTIIRKFLNEDNETASGKIQSGSKRSYENKSRVVVPIEIKSEAESD